MSERAAALNPPTRAGTPEGNRPLLALMLRSSGINVLILVVSTLNAALVARLLGVEGRGHLFLLFLPLYFAPLISNLGLHRLAVYLGKREQSQAMALHLSVIAVASTAFAVLWCLIYPLFIADKYTSLNLAIVAVTLAGTLTFSAAIYLQALATIDRQFWIPDLAKFILPFLNAALLGAAFVFDIDSPEIVLVFQIVCRVAEIGFLIWALRRLFGRHRLSHRGGLPREDRAYSLKLWQSDLMSLLQLHLDKILVSFIATTTEVGIYAVAVTLALYARQLVGNVTNVIIARVNARDSDRMRRLFGRWALIYLALGIVLWPVCLQVLHYPVAWFFGEAFRGVAPITNFLLLNVFFSSLAWLIVQPQVLTGDNTLFVRAQLVGTIVFVAGSVWAFQASSLTLFIGALVTGSVVKCVLCCVPFLIQRPHPKQEQP